MSKEIEKFYDALLRKVLGLPKVQQEIAESRKDEEWNKKYDIGEFEIENEVLESFIAEGDDKDVLAVPEIWAIVQEAIRDSARHVTYNVKTFIAERGELDANDIYVRKITEIYDGLYHALKRKHGKE